MSEKKKFINPLYNGSHNINPNKNVSLFRVMGLKILGRVGTHIFFILFCRKNIILCILKGILPFKMHKNIFFSDNMKKILGFTSEVR